MDTPVVPVQTLPPVELGGTQVAGEGLLPRVNPTVFHQLMFKHEAFPALPALVGPLLLVASLVSLQVVLPGEAHLAHAAHVGLGVVESVVDVQLGFGLENLAAARRPAREPRLGVDLHVPLHLLAPDEHLPTDGAGVPGVPRVGRLVVLQVRLPEALLAAEPGQKITINTRKAFP